MCKKAWYLPAFGFLMVHTDIQKNRNLGSHNNKWYCAWYHG